MIPGSSAGNSRRNSDGAGQRVIHARALAVAALLLSAAPALSRPEASAPVPVILDTDVGDDIDDAFALALALSDRRVEVVGITAAWGDTRTRVLLIRRLLAALGRSDVPVAQGPAGPGGAPFTQKTWALGATDKGPTPDAIEFIRSRAAARPGQITLVALAPLVTVQATLARDPAAFATLKGIVVMGGSIGAGYRAGGALPVATPSAEYNIASAPAALTAVLGSGVPVTLFPLDSTQIDLEEVERDRLFAHGSAATDALTLLYHQWRLWNVWGRITPTLFDVVPVAWLIDPSVCAPMPMRIAVDAQGYTRPIAGPPNAAVCLASDAAGVRRRLLDDLTPDPRKAP
jgi:inosine-uridine nucleoside N-ribohydrolase